MKNKNRKKSINLLPENSFNISITEVFKKYDITPEELDKESGLRYYLNPKQKMAYFQSEQIEQKFSHKKKMETEDKEMNKTRRKIPIETDETILKKYESEDEDLNVYEPENYDPLEHLEDKVMLTLDNRTKITKEEITGKEGNVNNE